MRVPAWVLWRYLLRRRSVGSTLGATAAVVAVALTFVHQTGTMVQRALDDSVALSQGGAAYVVTDPGADHGDVLREAGFVPVEESLTRVGGTLVQLRSTHGPGGVPGTVVEGRLPRLVKDTAHDPAMRHAPPAPAKIGAFITTPIVLGDRQNYGTLCTYSFSANDALGERQLQAMEKAAHHIAQAVGRRRAG